MIELKLELAEVNGILNALGNMPYPIAKIQAQAQPQVEAK